MIEPLRPWYALDKTISSPLSPPPPLQRADKGMNGEMEECTYSENRHQGASGSRETWLGVLLPLGSFEAALIGFVPLWAEDRNCQCVQSCQALSTVHKSLWCERTNERMNEWMKDGSKSFLFLTFTTAAWSHALMNNGNHLTWALCKLSLFLLISVSLFLISNINMSFLELLILISLSFQFESFSNMQPSVISILFSLLIITEHTNIRMRAVRHRQRLIWVYINIYFSF